MNFLFYSHLKCLKGHTSLLFDLILLIIRRFRFKAEPLAIVCLGWPMFPINICANCEKVEPAGKCTQKCRQMGDDYATQTIAGVEKSRPTCHSWEPFNSKSVLQILYMPFATDILRNLNYEYGQKITLKYHVNCYNFATSPCQNWFEKPSVKWCYFCKQILYQSWHKN